VNGSGTTYRIDVHLYDECTLSERDDLIDAAAASQAALDAEASGIWSWYSSRPTVWKVRLRICILASQKAN